MFVEIIFIGVALSILFGAIQLMLAPLNDSKPKENNDPLEPIRTRQSFHSSGRPL